ncbi:MAG: hypothetical protein F9K42_09400, partial [Ignavibacterium sp.]
ADGLSKIEAVIEASRLRLRPILMTTFAMVLGALPLALAAGADIYEASFLANYAGGLVCEEVGIVPIEIDKLFNTIIRENK